MGKQPPESCMAGDSLDPDEISRQEQLVIGAIAQRPVTDDGGATCDEAEIIIHGGRPDGHPDIVLFEPLKN